MFACKTLLQLVVVGCVCAHFCGCNWVCTCTLCSDFTYVCAWKHERASGQETVEQQKSEGDCASDFLRTAQTNSLCFSPLHQMHFIFLEHISRNQFWEMEGPGFVCLGQDGTVWSLSTVKFFFFFFWGWECKDIGVSRLSPGYWKQTSNITVWKQDYVCFDYSVSQKSGPLCNISQYFVQTEKTFMCNTIAQYIFSSLSCILLFMRWDVLELNMKIKTVFLLHCWKRLCRMINLSDLCAVNNLLWFMTMNLALCFWISM